MPVCPACGKENNVSDRYCGGCGIDLVQAGVPGVATSQWLTQQNVPKETNGKAIASMVTGLLCFFWPSSIAAVILGHMARTEIKKSAGRQGGDGMALAGLILGYLGISLVPLILIIAAIAIPNLLRSRIAANEAATVASLRSLNLVLETYRSTYGQYPPNMEVLGPPRDGGKPDANGADLIDSDLARGTKWGYYFRFEAADENGDGIMDAYTITADPITPGTTGQRYFFTDTTGIIRVESTKEATAESPPI
jgi:type II secretory pathway pseudopilin PulG